jgi:predicted nucleic acid-binding protein
MFQKAGIALAEACRAWAKARMTAGVRLLVPEIIHYEIRRELLRLGKTQTLGALEAFVRAESDRFLSLTSSDLRLAAELWSEARRRGTPTADARALYIDVILAAQVRNLGIPTPQVVVATSNVRHLSQFIPCEPWELL